jgi:hypothetical protein
VYRELVDLHEKLAQVPHDDFSNAARLRHRIECLEGRLGPIPACYAAWQIKALAHKANVLAAIAARTAKLS